MGKGGVSTSLLNTLLKWLTGSYIFALNNFAYCSLGKDIKVCILYLHDISINRLTQPLPHNEIFRKLCGEQYSASVALVLTMCENVSPAVCKERTEYLTKEWKNRMGEGALVYCHNGTKKSAWNVVAGLGVHLGSS